MKGNSYITYETALLLKEAGFNELCEHSFGTGVMYKGEAITFEEELDLRNEGHGDEIEHVPGIIIYNMWNYNRSDWQDDAETCSCPTYEQVIRWLMEEHDIYCLFDIEQDGGAIVFYPNLCIVDKNTGNLLRDVTKFRRDIPSHGFKTIEEVYEYEIRLAAKFLKK